MATPHRNVSESYRTQNTVRQEPDWTWNQVSDHYNVKREMSTIRWQGNRLIQRINSKDSEEELGKVEFDENAQIYVLWLKDTCNFFNTSYGYVRGDEYGTLDLAKKQAANSVSARLLHHLWMIPKTKREIKDWAENTEDKRNLVLTKKDFLDWARKERKFQVIVFFAGVLLTLAIEHIILPVALI